MVRWTATAALLAAAGLAAFAQEQPKTKTRPQDRDRPRDGNLKAGDPAPNFRLKSLDGKSQVELASFKGKKPVVLVFGSYT
jgi:cytochrome oxidase Cu insertion factor (SCO1/SenC/PrrC family)